MASDRSDIDAAALDFYWKNELPPAQYRITPGPGQWLAWVSLVIAGTVITVCGILAGFVGYILLE